VTLSVLLSFAQFEREVTAERIRDKIAASKRKGLWMGGNAPLGYQPDGRTLKIDAVEATVVRKRYDLYLEHRVIRRVKERAEALGLSTKRRERPDGSVTGGGVFDRGHIHHILTNPIYAGRIRHKEQVYEGQHSAIIDPAVWDQVQGTLQGGAAKSRGTKQLASRSPLAGRLFDETGDRLTPSHSRKSGKRLRYYISRRLVVDRSSKHPDAWRLPTEQLESLLSDAVRNRFDQPNAVAQLLIDPSATEISVAQDRLATFRGHRKFPNTTLLKLIERVDIRPGSLRLKFGQDALADPLLLRPEKIDPDQLVAETCFRMRRRGVELKLHLGVAPTEVDHTLVQNLVKARRWLPLIIDGKTFAEIAESEGTSKRRVQDIVDLALLAPDVIDAIATGEQHDGVTTDYLIKTGFSAIWSVQQEKFAEL